MRAHSAVLNPAAARFRPENSIDSEIGFPAAIEFPD
jgi:hypothetical protein